MNIVITIKILIKASNNEIGFNKVTSHIAVDLLQPGFKDSKMVEGVQDLDKLIKPTVKIVSYLEAPIRSTYNSN